MRFEMWGHCRRNDIGEDEENEEEEDACENFFSNALGTYAKGNNQVRVARYIKWCLFPKYGNPGFQIEDDAESGNSGNLWNFGMAFIGEAVPSMRLTAQMLQKLLLEGILDQVVAVRVTRYTISVSQYGNPADFPGGQQGAQRGGRGDLADGAGDAPARHGGGGDDVPQCDDQVGS